jgi:hypothetical protein
MINKKSYTTIKTKAFIQFTLPLLLGFKSEGSNPEHGGNGVNVKVQDAKAQNSESETREMGNKCIHRPLEGSQGGLFIA